MPTHKGPFSSDDKECNTGVGLDRDSYNPGPTPNKYVSNAQGKMRIQLDTDAQTKAGDGPSLTGWRKRGGFSGPVSD